MLRAQALRAVNAFTCSLLVATGACSSSEQGSSGAGGAGAGAGRPAAGGAGRAMGGSANAGGAGNAAAGSGAATGGSAGAGATAAGSSGAGGTSGANGGSSGNAGGNDGGTTAGGSAGDGAGGRGGAGMAGRASGGSAGTGGGAGGNSGAAGSGAAGAGGGDDWFPCDGTTTGYDVTMTKSGANWIVMSAAGAQKYMGADMQAALTAAYGSLSSGRTTKESILVAGDGDIPASAQLAIPSYTVLNVCGTLNVSGTPSGSDRSPLYARGKTAIDIPHLKLTGSPQYGVFIRETDHVHLGRIDLRLEAAAGIGIRVDSGGSASTETTFNQDFTLDYVYGTGMGSHIVETYGIDGIEIGTVEGKDVGECGLLLNRSINANVELVTCDGCGTGTGYAAFRVANDVGKVGTEFPAGNIHVGKVVARNGGRGIFSVSGSGGLTIDALDVANTGNTSILLQNTYETTIAAVSGTVVGGIVQLTNDTDNTNSGRYPPSKNVHIANLTLSGGAEVRQDWCSEFGSNGCTAENVSGGTVSMCP